MVNPSYSAVRLKLWPQWSNLRTTFDKSIRMIMTMIIIITMMVREVIKKKNGKKGVSLTAWVDPPPPSPEAVRKM